MGFVHNLNPVLLELGPLQIRWYGLVYALGFILVYLSLKKAAQKGILELKEDEVDSCLLWLMLGVVGGARLFHVIFWQPAYFLANPLKILFVWEGGLAFHGGVAGLLVATYLFAKKKKVNFLKFLDVLTLPAVFALALGRIANFVNGELWGRATSVGWCVEFKNAEGCRHPYQLYSALKRFLVFGMLYALQKTKRKDGYIFWMSLLLFSIGRFILDFYREDMRWVGLSMGQYSSLVVGVVVGVILYKYYQKK